MATEHNQAISLSFQCNENGAVFADLQGQTVYLGKSCDAYVPGHGTGHWWYAASGFVVSAGAYNVKFNSDVSCNIPYCRPPK